MIFRTFFNVLLYYIQPLHYCLTLILYLISHCWKEFWIKSAAYKFFWKYLLLTFSQVSVSWLVWGPYCFLTCFWLCSPGLGVSYFIQLFPLYPHLSHLLLIQAKIWILHLTLYSFLYHHCCHRHRHHCHHHRHHRHHRDHHYFDRASPCSPGCCGSSSVDQASFKLRNLPASPHHCL